MIAKKKEIKKAAPRGKSKTVATSAAILGRPVAKASAGPDLKKVKPEWQKFCLHLLELREQLIKQMNGLAAGIGAGNGRLQPAHGGFRHG